MLVSVITPTWNRHDLLLNRCIPSVEAQTYPDIEHIIVSDGPDPDLLGDRDFSYSQMLRHYTNGHSDILGTLHPYYGGIDTSMVLHRRELLEKATWRVDYPVFGAPDWDLIDRWLQAGTTWSFVDEITVDYYMKA